MHRSGMTVSNELKQAFSEACDGDNVGFLKIEIIQEDYVLTNQGPRQANL